MIHHFFMLLHAINWPMFHGVIQKITLAQFFSETVYRVRQKSSPLKLFAVFTAIIWDFNVKFHSFI